jgi:hypothetical protein
VVVFDASAADRRARQGTAFENFGCRHEIGSDESTLYKDPAPLIFDNHIGHFDAKDGALLVEPGNHFATREDARAVVDPFLRSWEIGTDLDANVGTIRFKFVGADIVDRNPPPPGTHPVIAVEAAMVSTGGLKAKLISTLSRYPAPSLFSATPEVEHAYQRWRAFKQDREPLQSMAYFVLTLIEAAGGRRQAANVYGIHFSMCCTKSAN